MHSPVVGTLAVRGGGVPRTTIPVNASAARHTIKFIHLNVAIGGQFVRSQIVCLLPPDAIVLL